MTRQILEAILEVRGAKGVAVVIETQRAHIMTRKTEAECLDDHRHDAFSARIVAPGWRFLV